ncbi:hypothetical protein WR25_04676 [Diploscapter pachys]|uniref:Uncharacterized protein n=1 Tax=Diploscapter pachys TaxID=2018661 RepID=A0A2A2K513_9BILA|nr:hypothetical protein WR25_04676 [Diploscapter pachys]
MIGGQLQHIVLAAQLCQPVVQLAGLLAGLHPLALPDGIVRVLHWQGRLFGLPALAQGQVGVDHFIDHDRHRPAIGYDMMQGQHQHVIVLGQAQQAYSQQRPLGQVERALDLPSHALADCLGGGVLQRFHDQGERRGRVDTLLRLATLLIEGMW